MYKLTLALSAVLMLGPAGTAWAQSNLDAAGVGGEDEGAAGVQFKVVGTHSLDMIAKYKCKDPTGSTTIVGVSIADLQAAGDAWRAIVSIGTGNKVQTRTNYVSPTTSGSPGVRSAVLGVGVYPSDHTVAGKTTAVFATPANDIPACFGTGCGTGDPLFDATASLRITYNGGGPACVLKRVLLGTAAS